MKKQSFWLVVSVMILVFPWIVKSPRWLTTANLMFYYIILAISWNLIMGYTGLFSFAHVAFAGIGGYGSSLLSIYLNIPPALGIIIGGGVAAFLGLLLGALCLRLRGFYLCLVTWAFAVIIGTLACTEYKYTGGTGGLTAPTLFRSMSGVPYYYVGLVITVIMLYSTFRLINSRIGLYLRSIREDEDAAEVMGIDTVKWKIFSFVLSSFWAGIAGGFYAHYLGLIDPSIVGLDEMGKVIMMVVIGGIGTLAGPLVGAIFVVFISEFIRGTIAIFGILAFSVIIILTMRFARGGLMGAVRYLYPQVVRINKKIFANYGHKNNFATKYKKWAK